MSMSLIVTVVLEQGTRLARCCGQAPLIGQHTRINLLSTERTKRLGVVWKNLPCSRVHFYVPTTSLKDQVKFVNCLDLASGEGLFFKSAPKGAWARVIDSQTDNIIKKQDKPKFDFALCTGCLLYTSDAADE